VIEEIDKEKDKDGGCKDRDERRKQERRRRENWRRIEKA
jgi:hypothetical protein